MSIPSTKSKIKVVAALGTIGAAYVGSIYAHEKAKASVHMKSRAPMLGANEFSAFEAKVRKIEKTPTRGPRGGLYYWGPQGKIYLKQG